MNDHILLVDDDPSILEGFEEILKQNDFSVCKAKNEKEAIHLISGHSCKAAIVDLVLGQSSGLDLIKEIKKLSSDTAVIVITGFPSVESAKESFKQGAFEYLEKPFEKDKLIETIRKAIDKKKAEKDLRRLKQQKETLDNLLCLNNEDLGARIRSIYSQMSIVIQGADKFSNCSSETAKNEYIHLIKLIALMAQNTLKKFLFNGLKIFILDNDLLSLNTLDKQLSELGCIVALSNNSKEAEQILQQSQDFDLCILEKDIEGLDGIQLTETIRKKISTQMPVIGIAENMDEEIQKSWKEAGITHILSKPIDMMHLKLLMIDLILNKKYVPLDTF